MRLRKVLLALSCGAAVCAMLPSVFAAGSDAGSLVTRRLTPAQYTQIIRDVFGPTIQIGGRFEPDQRVNGLLAVGTSQVSVSSTGLAQYDLIARLAAEQVVDADRRGMLIPCKPANAKGPDDACAGQFLSKVGKLLYRRPLTNEELAGWVKVAHDGAAGSKDFYHGLGKGLSSLLVSPQFLFRTQIAATGKNGTALNASSKASQLSFWLWNTAPDAELLRAAEKGELDSKKGLAKQVERMLASPRLEHGVRAFFSDMLVFDDFESLSKDAAIYPKYTSAVATDAQEQTLRTIVDHLLKQKGDYRDLFTSRKTFLTPLLGALYGVPVAKVTPNGVPDLWVPYEYAENDPRAGMLSQASFVALHSHPGRSSPTLRGKALREKLLCQRVPDPPNAVNFTLVQDTENPQYKTARDRVNAHLNNPVCAGCHKITDPAGLALEVFDSAGGFRTAERGQTIDTSGEFSGVKFANTVELAKVIHDTPALTSCLVNRVYAYAVGRPATKTEQAWLEGDVSKKFAAGGYRIADLMKEIATSNELFAVKAEEREAMNGGSQVASRTDSQKETSK